MSLSYASFDETGSECSRGRAASQQLLHIESGEDHGQGPSHQNTRGDSDDDDDEVPCLENDDEYMRQQNELLGRLRTPGALVVPRCCPRWLWSRVGFLCALVSVVVVLSSPMAFLLSFWPMDISLEASSLSINSFTRHLDGKQSFTVRNRNFFNAELDAVSMTAYYSLYNDRWFQFENPTPEANLSLSVPGRTSDSFKTEFRYVVQSERVISGLFWECNSGSIPLAFRGTLYLTFLGRHVHQNWGPLMVVANCSVFGDDMLVETTEWGVVNN